MDRVKIIFPGYNSLYVATIPVRIGDINYGNHVGNDAILSVIHEARMQLLTHYGYSEMNAGGNSMIMADVMIAYKAEAFYGDILTVKIYTDTVSGNTFNLLYRISTVRNGKETDVAHAKTGMVCFNYQTRKIAAMTDELKNFLESNR